MIRTFEVKGVTISIGKNANGNDILWKNSQPSDTWLHLENSSSPHAVIHTNEYNKDIIREAGVLVKQYSKCKNEKKVKVIYCPISNLIATKTKGMVQLVDTPKVITI